MKYIIAFLLSINCLFGAAQMAGGPDSLVIADADRFSFTDGAGNDLPFSATAWVCADTTDYAYICEKGEIGALDREYYFNTGSFFIFSGSGAIRQAVTTTSTLTPTVWYHVAFTYDGSESSNGMKIYWNGVRVDDGTNNSGSYTGMSNQANNIYTACAKTTTGFISVGQKIRGLTFWNKELSVAEIKENMYMGDISAISKLDNVVEYFPFFGANGDSLGASYGIINGSTATGYGTSYFSTNERLIMGR